VSDGPGAAARANVIALLAAIVAIVAATPAIAEPASTPQVLSANPAPERSTATLGDPLESAECRRMLAALDAEEAAVAESSRASGVTASDRRRSDVRLAPARRNAVRSCLARRADPASLSSERLVRPAPIATPPIATPSLAVAPASNPAPTPTTARAAPLASPGAAVERPYAITSCDAGGCWANDGSRLNRVGPNLWGPRGICTLQGSLVQCP